MRQVICTVKNQICLLILSSCLLFASLGEAGTLKGIVKGKGGDPKAYAKIEIGGPQTITTLTDADGAFTVELKGGRYTVQVIERNRRMRFSVDVPQTGSKEEMINLDW